MSTYSDISKRIGWEKREVIMPGIEECRHLLEEVKGGNVYAFERVFTIYRFVGTGDHGEAGNVITEAFQIGEKIFREQ